MLPGLADPVLDSQRIFRAVLDAIAHPGRVLELPELAAAPAPLHQATLAVSLALVDFETPLWLDTAAATPAALEYLRFHCGCRVVESPSAARFAVVADPSAMPRLDAFDLGTDEFPDRSATIIVQTRALSARGSWQLTGPGIAGTAHLEAAGLPEMFWRGLRANHALFPRGVDVLLTDRSRLAALPRTTRLEL